MHLLFAAFVVSLCALLWVAVSVARHIRRHPHRERLPGLGEGEREVRDEIIVPVGESAPHRLRTGNGPTGNGN